MAVVKTIIPAAGLGLRFFPFTKSMPKEMIPVGDKPAIQHIVEEALLAEIEHFLIVTNRRKHAIVDHFDHTAELELLLKDRSQLNALRALERIARHSTFSYILQPEPLGLGHAIWAARHHIGKEYFSIMLPDDIIVAKTPALLQILRIARQERASVIAVQEVPRELVSAYGIVEVKKQISPSLFQVANLVEKPDIKNAPSHLAVVGRYVLSPKIFSSLEELSTDTEGELQLTDAIDHMIRSNEKVYAYKVQGTRYDIGSPIGWIKAVIGFGIQDPIHGPHIKKFLETLETPDSVVYNPIKAIEHPL